MGATSLLLHLAVSILLAVWYALLAFGVLVVLALPLVAWIEASRVVLWPVLGRIGTRRLPTQFGLVDLGCLVVEMSALGVLVAKVASRPHYGALAVLLSFLGGAVILSSWRLSVRWLARTRVRSLVRRIVFQIFVVPTAIFFPLLFGASLAVACRWIAGEDRADRFVVLSASLIAAAVTAFSLRVSRKLAGWVASTRGEGV